MIEESIQAPASTRLRAGVETGELRIVIPSTQLVVTERLVIAWQSVDLVTGLGDRERWTVD